MEDHISAKAENKKGELGELGIRKGSYLPDANCTYQIQTSSLVHQIS